MGEPSSTAITTVPCHLGGITKLCFSPDGSTIFTGGSDCLVRIHKADDPDSEPGFHDNHSDAVTSLTCSKTDLITASIDNVARRFSYPQNEFEGFITRSSGVPIRWVSVEKSGDRVAVCSDDLLVKIINVHDTNKISLLSDNTKSVRSASWDPSGKFLTTASCDGKLKIYDTSGTEAILLKIMEGVISSSEPDSPISCYAAWHPSGAFFVVPTRTNEIGIVNKEGWSKGPTFSLEGHKSMVGEVAWSPNGKYLASAADTQILVWSTESRTVVAKYKNPEGQITGLSFSPSKNLLAFTSIDGSFHRWAEPIPSDLPSPVTSDAAQAKKIERLLDDDPLFDADEDLEEKGEDIEVEDDFGDDWIVDDDGVYGAGEEKEEKWGKGRTEVVNVTKAQAAFTPGSTSWKAKKRYLDFNMIGVIDVTDQETHNVVNVEFHDKSARRGYHFQDHAKFSMASLGERGIVYASATDGEQPSTVHYRAYDSWASQSDWQVTLLPGEDALLVASGGSFASSNEDSGMGSVVVATSKGFVRFFSSSGIQRYLWRLGEEAVSMVAGKEMVMIIHREGGTSLDGCQNLRYSLMDFENFELLQEGRIPLPKKTTLVWIGFTSEGAPAMYDSSGLLSVLDRFRRPGQARWVPLLDSTTLSRREGKQESYWPVGVTATHFTCVILKGSEKEPWFPRPLIQELEMHMPLLAMDNQQSKLEESLIRGDIQLNTLRDVNLETPSSDVEYTIKEREVDLDKEMLQLVQGACKADSLQRALDVTRLMYNSGTIDAAAKVAAFYHLPGLQERILAVKTEKEGRRRKERERKSLRRSVGADYPVSTAGGSGTPKAGFQEFAPRNGIPRRSFGGVGARDSTPISTAPMASGRSESYIPETPREEIEMTPLNHFDDESSPEGKRKRIEESTVEMDDFVPIPKKRVDDLAPPSGPAKNPFAKKAVPSNPFAKNTPIGKPLDALKSTSFFERVDNIESSDRTKVSSKSKSTKPKDGKPSTVNGGKQTTLFGMKKSMQPPKPVHRISVPESLTSTETEGEDESQGVEIFEETQMDEVDDSGVLGESHVQETASPEAMDMAA